MPARSGQLAPLVPAPAVSVTPAPAGERPSFRHYKGGLYRLVCEATLESDLTPMIVYTAADGSVWIRPKAVFFELIDVDGTRRQRFTPVD